ncbi:MAG: Gfo/Idh/MocA family oxidoreductase [Tissierellia bacterium]|nr:Gfo/Idh/MocA family oxidoreductase [Tissierellia bacterium]
MIFDLDMEAIIMLNFAIIGCGRISYKHVEAIVNNHSEARLIAVCDTIEERAKKKAEEYFEKMASQGILVEMPIIYTHYEELLKDSAVDIVTIATESGKHARVSIDAMNAGKHVIVEKPMAMSIEDADRMIEASERNNVKLCVCHQNRFNPAVQKLRQAVEEGRFGRIFAGNARVLWNRNEDYYKQAPWRGTREQDGGCLMNQCIHNIDLLQWMLGEEIEQVNAMLGNFTHPYIEMEDYGSIQIRFKNGAIGNVEGTVCVYPQNLEETLTILGEKGTVVIGGKAVNKIHVWQFEDKKDTLEQVQQECNEEIENVYGWGHTFLFNDMIQSIHENRESYIDGMSGKKAIEIVLDAYKITHI